MSHSVLASFDPLAVHPFTNSSGLLPKPAAPSQYPTSFPSPASFATPPTTPTQGPVASPKPHRASHAGTAKAPIFVPFRPERSSPELEDILLRKKVSDVMSNKQTWSIDQTPMPPSSVAARR